LVRDKLTAQDLNERKRLIADPALFPFIDGFAAMRQPKRG
jgi:hypothetical protein